MNSKLDKYTVKKHKPPQPEDEAEDIAKLFDPIKAQKWLEIDPCGAPC